MRRESSAGSDIRPAAAELEARVDNVMETIRMACGTLADLERALAAVARL